MTTGGTKTELPSGRVKQRGGGEQRLADTHTVASPGRRGDQRMRSRLFPLHSIPVVGTRLGAGVGVTTGVGVFVGVRVDVPVRVGVGVGTDVCVRVTVGVRVGLNVRVGVPATTVGVRVGVRVRVGVPTGPVGVPLTPVGVGVRVAVRVGVFVAAPLIRIVVGSLAVLLEATESPIVDTNAVLVTVG